MWVVPLVELEPVAVVPDVLLEERVEDGPNVPHPVDHSEQEVLGVAVTLQDALLGHPSREAIDGDDELVGVHDHRGRGTSLQAPANVGSHSELANDLPAHAVPE